MWVCVCFVSVMVMSYYDRPGFIDIMRLFPCKYAIMPSVMYFVFFIQFVLTDKGVRTICQKKQFALSV